MERGIPRHSASPPFAAEETGPDPRRWWILVAVGTGTFLNVLDMSMLNVALPVITREMRTEVAVIQWVVTTFLLVITSLLLTAGRLADLYGRKRMYVAGMVVFSVAAALCGFSQTVEHLIAFRALQAVGAALVQSIGTAINTSAFAPSDRGKVLGIQMTTVALGGMSGPALGGLIADWLGWRGIFFIRLPPSLIVLAILIFVLRDDRPVGRRSRFDFAGSALLFLALSSLLLALGQGRSWGWGSPAIVGLFTGAVVFTITFIAVERRAPDPIVPLAVFRNRLFSAASASAVFFFMGSSASYFIMPFYLQQVLGYSPTQAGLLLITASIMMSVCGPLSGALSDRYGSGVLSPAGVALAALGLYELSALNAGSSPIDVAIRLALVGIGMGMFSSPNSNALLGSVPRQMLGLASGMMAANRNLGNALGVAVAGTVLTNQMAYYASLPSGGNLTDAALQTQAFLGGFHDAFVVGAALAGLGFVASLVRGPHPAPATAETASASGVR